MINGQAAMAMTNASLTRQPSIVAGRLIGLTIIAVAPTIFWTVMLNCCAWAYGRPLTFWASAVVATVMFAFLTCIWASFALSERRASDAE
jgi:ABC-type Na+ efflux pump permease subunit